MEGVKNFKMRRGPFFFFFFFLLFTFQNDKICFPRKESGKITLPPQKNFPVMPLNVGWWFCHDSLLSISNKIHIYPMEVVIVSFWSPNGFSLSSFISSFLFFQINKKSANDSVSVWLLFKCTSDSLSSWKLKVNQSLKTLKMLPFQYCIP